MVREKITNAIDEEMEETEDDDYGDEDFDESECDDDDEFDDAGYEFVDD